MRQTDRLKDEQTNGPTNIHTYRQRDRMIDRHDRNKDKQTDQHLFIQTDRQIDKCTDRQIDR